VLLSDSLLQCHGDVSFCTSKRNEMTKAEMKTARISAGRVFLVLMRGVEPPTY